MVKRMIVVGLVACLLFPLIVRGAEQADAVAVYDQYLKLLKENQERLFKLEKRVVVPELAPALVDLYMGIDGEVVKFNETLSHAKISDAESYKKKLGEVQKQQKEFIKASLGLPAFKKRDILKKYSEWKNPEDGKVGGEVKLQTIKLNGITLTQYPALNQALYKPSSDPKDPKPKSLAITLNCGYFATWFAHLFADDLDYVKKLLDRKFFVDGLGTMIDVVIGMRGHEEIEEYGIEELNEDEIARVIEKFKSDKDNKDKHIIPMNNVFYVGSATNLNKDALIHLRADFGANASDVHRARAVEWLQTNDKGTCVLIVVTSSKKDVAFSHWAAVRITKDAKKVTTIDFAHSLSMNLFKSCPEMIYVLLKNICELTGQDIYDILLGKDATGTPFLQAAFNDSIEELVAKSVDVGELEAKLSDAKTATERERMTQRIASLGEDKAETQTKLIELTTKILSIGKNEKLLNEWGDIFKKQLAEYEKMLKDKKSEMQKMSDKDLATKWDEFEEEINTLEGTNIPMWNFKVTLFEEIMDAAKADIAAKATAKKGKKK